MKSTIRNAALAIAAAFALAIPAIAGDAPTPAAFARIEIRGLDAFFSAADRIAAPYVPAGQAKGMFIGACNARGLNPFEVVDGGGTVRFMACGTLDENCFLLDLPAAGGDTAACLDKWTEALGTIDAPEGFDMPEGGRFLRAGPATGAGALLFPRGERIVVIDCTQLNPVSPAQAVALLDAAPAVPAGGVLAAAIDFEAMLPLLAKSGAGTSGARLHGILADSAFPFRALAFGLGLDDADRFRVGFSVAYAPDAPQTRIISGIGTPISPLASAILFPDAVAATTYRQEMSALSDGELLSFLSGENSLASIVGDDDPQTAAVRDAMAAAYIPFIRLLGDEGAAALLPADEGDGSASAALLAFPADPQATLDGLPACINGVIDAFADAIRSAADGDIDDEDDDDIPDMADAVSRLRIEPAGERTVQETPVRRYVLRMAEDDETPARDFATFDAAAAGPALYLGTLPDGRLGDVLADLAAGHTAKVPVAAMSPFAGAYGDAPDGAACGYVRLRPLLSSVLPALRNLLQTMGADDIGLEDLFPLAPFALSRNGDSALPDITLASTQRWIPDASRLETTVSLTLSDLHSAIDGITQAALALRTEASRHVHPDSTGDEDEEDSEDDDW